MRKFIHLTPEQKKKILTATSIIGTGLVTGLVAYYEGKEDGREEVYEVETPEPMPVQEESSEWVATIVDGNVVMKFGDVAGYKIKVIRRMDAIKHIAGDQFSFELEDNIILFECDGLYLEWKIFNAVEAAQKKNREEIASLKAEIEKLKLQKKIEDAAKDSVNCNLTGEKQKDNPYFS